MLKRDRDVPVFATADRHSPLIQWADPISVEDADKLETASIKDETSGQAGLGSTKLIQLWFSSHGRLKTWPAGALDQIANITYIVVGLSRTGGVVEGADFNRRSYFPPRSGAACVLS